MTTKSGIKYLNRAYRKATKGWLGHPDGFKSKRDWKRACRIYATNYDLTDFFLKIENQSVADDAVVEDISNWDADHE